MLARRPFRFGAAPFTAPSATAWAEQARRIESWGYDIIGIGDHFSTTFPAVPALMAAAAATTTLRVTCTVFDNDYRHPALLAKEAAAIDFLSDGRLEFGIGAGWAKWEYDQTGIPFDPAGVRIARMTEAVRLIKRIFTEEHPVSFTGDHYTLTDLICPPHPVQRPHPPIIIGGGSGRILAVAAREADIVGITTRAHADGSKDTADLTAAATDQKISWIRDAAGERLAHIELNAVVSDVIVTDDRQGEVDRLASAYGVPPEEILASPLVLIGSTDEMVEQVLERRERYGFSYIVVTEPNMDKLAPVVARLAGA